MTDYLAATYGDRIADVYDELYELAEETDAAVELLAELAAGGPVLELEHRWADWRRTPFTASSTGHVSVWRRP